LVHDTGTLGVGPRLVHAALSRAQATVCGIGFSERANGRAYPARTMITGISPTGTWCDSHLGFY
jgi:hypothetical protein